MMNSLKSQARRGSWIIVAVAAMEALLACAPAVAQTAAPPPPAPQMAEAPGTIQVTGQAYLSVPADRVRISFTVETEAKTAGMATTLNAERMDAVVRAVRELNVEGLDLETSGYALRPEYEVARDGSGVRTISGYRAQNTLGVTVDDVDASGRILDAAVEAGANRVANLSFEASDTRAARLDALRAAGQNAREQAEVIAEAMGVRLGKILEIQGGASAPNPRSPGGFMVRASAEVTTPVESGEQMVSASLTVTFAIVESGL